MSLKLEIPHERQIVVFEIFPDKVIDVGGYDIDYDMLMESMGDEPTLPFKIARKYTNHGTSGLAESIESIQVVGKAIEKDHIEHGGSGIGEFCGIDDPESSEALDQLCSQEMTLLYIYHLFTVYERAVQHANAYHSGDVTKSITHHRPSAARHPTPYKFIPNIMSFLDMWWDRTASGSEKWVPALETGVSDWDIRMLDVFDPQILWWDNVWSICEYPVDSVLYECIADCNTAAYVVSHKEQDVAIFWAWRADPESSIERNGYVRKYVVKRKGGKKIVKRIISHGGRDLTDKEARGVSKTSISSQKRPGGVMIVDGVHSIFSNPRDNKQLLNVIAGAATKAFQSDPSLDDIRFGNYYGTDINISRLLQSQKIWPILGSNMFYSPRDGSENMYMLHPNLPEFIQDKSRHAIKVYQWLIAQR